MAVKKKLSSSSTAIAPSSTANLGPGYDIFGLALDAFYDRVNITKVAGKDGSVVIKMSTGAISSAPESNSAGLVIKKMMHDFSITDNLDVVIKKGVPAGYGLGSSAASAAAAAVAFVSLYSLKVGKYKLVEYAAEGEIASAGARHYDNVSASVLGGFTITSIRQEGIKVIRIKPPKDLFMVVAVPSIPVPAKKTEVARGVLPGEVPLKSAVHNVSNASTIVAGFMLGDVEMIGYGINGGDVIVEPARRHLIPGYDTVRKNALAAGAIAVTISGAGPSMIALFKEKKIAKNVAVGMATGFSEAGVECRTFACEPSKGARVV